MQSKPLTKEDVAQLNNWQTRLVPLKTYREGRQMQEAVVEKTLQPVQEREDLKDTSDTDLVRNTLQDLILTTKKNKHKNSK